MVSRHALLIVKCLHRSYAYMNTIKIALEYRIVNHMPRSCAYAIDYYSVRMYTFANIVDTLYFCQVVDYKFGGFSFFHFLLFIEILVRPMRSSAA
jgi:hypothetical protein